ncbi:ATP-binding protein [Spirosoma foliorum]|uniref:histidine kinase n=1 Tax=Spirosoma foliorum TaxID=2710596 RepID=A0A7G5H0Y1_9BACT|nr:ATP-binding protein [Spirosoma foliorum]QMW04773.1 histidine kinase [Spirosoma foliorum]
MKSILLIGCLSLIIMTACAQSAFRIDSLPQDGILLDKGWKWHLGDNSDWAKPDFDDARWDTLNPTREIALLHQLPQQGIGWLRIRLHVVPLLRGKIVCLSTIQVGATELFLNGTQVAEEGKIGASKRIQEATFTPVSSIVLGPDSVQVIAVRYAFATDRLFSMDRLNSTPFFGVRLCSVDYATNRRELLKSVYVLEYTLFGIFLVLGVLQLIFFVSSPTLFAHLYFGLFLIAQGATHFLDAFTKDGPPAFLAVTRIILFNDYFNIVFCLAVTFSAIFYLLGVYVYFNQPKRALFFVTATLTLATIPTYLFSFLDAPGPFMWVLGFIVPWTDILRVGLVAARQQKAGAKLFSFSHSILLTAFILYTLVAFVPMARSILGDLGDDLFTISFLVLALTITLLLTQERANTNRLLQKQLIDLEILSQKNIAQEQEKQQLLANQNQLLEHQVEARTAELKASQTQLIQKEKLASLGELTAGIAHEIQNPLNFVNNFAEVSNELVSELREEEAKPNRDDELIADLFKNLSSNLQKINHHGGRASSIVKGMLEHSRTSSGDKQPTNLNVLADEYFKIAYHGQRAKEKTFDCELITDFDATVGKVDLIPQDMGRVLLNLYNNAFYAVNERVKQRTNANSNYQPRIEVSTQRSESDVIIRVKDNGTGIPESVTDKIFQPFFTTKPTGEGTGLGLSLSYDIITKGHGGTLTMESIVGEGTEFIIRFSTN